MILAPPEWYNDERTYSARRPVLVRSESRKALPPNLAKLQRERRGAKTAAARQQLSVLAHRRAAETIGLARLPDSLPSPEPLRGARYARQEVFQATLAAFGMDATELMATSRVRETVMPRQAAAYVMRTRTTASLPQIGEILNRDHSTIKHAVELVENQWDAFAPLVEAIEKELGL